MAIENREESMKKRILEAPETIITTVASYYGFDVTDLKERGRAKELSKARNIAIYFFYKKTMLSVPEIGRLFGDRDSGPLLMILERCEKFYSVSSEFRNDVQMLEVKLKTIGFDNDLRSVTWMNDKSPESILLNDAHSYYCDEMNSESENDGIRYLIQKGYSTETEDTYSRYELGWCHGRNGFVLYLSSNGVDFDLAEKIGLISFDEEGDPYDTFQNRILFPIKTINGEVIGFSGLRVIRGEEPVFLNRIRRDNSIGFFGLAVAMPIIKETRSLEIVEFPTDVLSEYVCGVKNAITIPRLHFMNMTEKAEAAHLIKVIADKVLLKYYDDDFGRKEIEQGRQVLEDAGIDVEIELSK